MFVMLRLRYFIFFTLFLMSLSVDAQEVFRELSNPSGQKIKARPIGVFGKKVRIELADHRKMNVGLDMFAKEDAKYLRDWALGLLGEQERLFGVDVVRKEDETKDYKKDVPLTRGGVAKGALRVREFDGYYEIQLENRSEFEIKGARLEYRIFSEQEQTASEDGDVKYLRESGSLNYDLEPHQALMKKTKIIKLVKTKLGKGIVWSSGGDLYAKAKMVGIWFRVYYGDTILYEYVQPTALSQRESW